MTIGGQLYLGGLYQPFADAVNILLQVCDYYGISVTVVAGTRSFAEQAALYAQGRTPTEVAQHVHKRGADGAVTDAWPGASAHNYGLAVDLDSPQLDAVMQIARQLGFGTVSWDPDHIEWPSWAQYFGISL